MVCWLSLLIGLFWVMSSMDFFASEFYATHIISVIIIVLIMVVFFIQYVKLVHFADRLEDELNLMPIGDAGIVESLSRKLWRGMIDDRIYWLFVDPEVDGTRGKQSFGLVAFMEVSSSDYDSVKSKLLKRLNMISRVVSIGAGNSGAFRVIIGGDEIFGDLASFVGTDSDKRYMKVFISYLPLSISRIRKVLDLMIESDSSYE